MFRLLHYSCGSFIRAKLSDYLSSYSFASYTHARFWCLPSCMPAAATAPNSPGEKKMKWQRNAYKNNGGFLKSYYVCVYRYTSWTLSSRTCRWLYCDGGSNVGMVNLQRNRGVTSFLSLPFSLCHCLYTHLVHVVHVVHVHTVKQWFPTSGSPVARGLISNSL